MKIYIKERYLKIILYLYNWVRGLVVCIRCLFLSDKYLYKYQYRELWYLSFFSKRFFLKLKSKIVSCNKEHIRQNGNCKVGFVVHTASMWSVDGLYHLLEEDSFYTPLIIIVPYATPNINQETFDFFYNKGYNVKRWDDASFNLNSLDIIVYTHPYVADEDRINIRSLRLDKLIVYVSYSYILSSKIEKIDMPVSLLSWKFFCDSKYYKSLLETKSRVYSGNAVFCGYPKMDAYYLAPNKKNITTDKKIIIYAPHQSVNYVGVKSATFDSNGWFLLYLANKYKDKLFWIVKPHPLLRLHSVEAGLFDNQEGYNYYLSCWEKTGCGFVEENGDYMGLFKESDAMITDSVSFLAEYQFTGKPLLLLESGRQTYNEFGDSIKEILYKCKGNDFSTIESFIEDFLRGKDYMQEKRAEFFHSKLEYSEAEGVLACDNLYIIFNSEIKEEP